MPTVLAQSNLPKSAAVVVSSETIVLRDPNNNILEKYTSDEQKQLSLKSYGVKPETLLSPGENKTKPITNPIIYYRWLQNIGEAYIDSLVNPKSSYKYEFAIFTDSSSLGRLFGSRSLVSEGSSTLKVISAFISRTSNTRFALGINMNNGSGETTSVSAIPNNFAKVVIDNGKVYVNDVEKAVIQGLSEEVVVDSSLFIFALSTSGVPTIGGSFYLAYFKIYDENGNILRDFVPASQQDVFGLYDKVSATLFVNANENGSFVGDNDESMIPSTNTLGFGNINEPDVIVDDSETM